MSDSVLDMSVWVLPFFLSLVGILLTLEPLSPQQQRHKWMWRIGLLVFGLSVSLLTYIQQARQRVQSATNLRELKEEALRQQQDSDKRTEQLSKNFQSFVAESLRQKQSQAIIVPKTPTAEEIASELDKRLSARLNAPSSTLAPVPRPSIQPKEATPSASTTSVATATSRPCHDDHLSECTDEQLLERLKPLVTNIETVYQEYSADTKRLDEIKARKFDWLRDLTGVGADRDSKWLKGLALAEQKASDRFRDCCAASALLYHQELLQRDHKVLDNAQLYEWVQNLLSPVGSKQWKKARDDGRNVDQVYFDLHSYQINLEYAVALSHISGRHS